MLNSLLFPEYPQLSVEAILDKEIVRPNELYCKGTIRSDLVCKARLNGETIIFGIEMQIGIDGDFSKRLFQYSVGLSNKYKYENSWMNAFFINTNKQPKYSKSIKLMENKNGEENELDFIKIIEIDLREEIKKINNDEDVFINGKKLDKKGKEWLKLLGLRTWCPREDEQFILPKGYILSSNSFLNQAIETLEDMPVFMGIDALNFERDKKKYDKKIEDIFKKGEKRGKKKGLIEGRKEGLEEGMQKGLQKGEIISNIKIAFKFFKDCHARQCGIADYYRNVHLWVTMGDEGSELDTSTELQRRKERLQWNRKEWFEKFYLLFYTSYIRTQERQTTEFQLLRPLLAKEPMDSPVRQQFRQESLPLMPLCNILTFDTRVIVLFLSTLAGLPWVYFLFEMTLLEALRFYTLHRHEAFCHRIHQKLCAI